MSEPSKWDIRFLELAKYISKWSKDPSTKVGCVVVGPDKEIRSTGFNGFPRGVKDDDRLTEREQKYPIICHAEENAIMNAARVGVPLNGCTAYVSHPPCCRCARSIIQAGIKIVVYYKIQLPENWMKDVYTAQIIMSEAEIKLLGVEENEFVRESKVDSETESGASNR